MLTFDMPLAAQASPALVNFPRLPFFRLGCSSSVASEAADARHSPGTVLMGGRKAIFLKIHYFHVLTG
jgi:hypothetical protein